MLNHQDIKKSYHLTEIIPIQRLRLISSQQEEKFLVVKRVKNRFMLAGLTEYLKNIGAGQEKAGDSVV